MENLFSGQIDESNAYSLFVLADSMGCDDLGIVSESEDLQFIYATLFVYWAERVRQTA